MHPATWFKVEFQDENVSKIVTFRPSALVPVDDDDKPIASYVVKPSVSRGYTARSLEPPVTKASLQKKALENSHIERLSFVDESRRLGYDAFNDAHNWAGKNVRVTSGRHLGHIGLVRSTGNGWVQVDTSFGEIAKRVSELELLDEHGFSDNDSQEYFSKKRGRVFLDDAHEKTPGSRRLNSNLSGSLSKSYKSGNRKELSGDELDSLGHSTKRHRSQDIVSSKQKKGYSGRPNLLEWKLKINHALGLDQFEDFLVPPPYSSYHFSDQVISNTSPHQPHMQQTNDKELLLKETQYFSTVAATGLTDISKSRNDGCVDTLSAKSPTRQACFEVDILKEAEPRLKVVDEPNAVCRNDSFSGMTDGEYERSPPHIPQTQSLNPSQSCNINTGNGVGNVLSMDHLLRVM